MLLKIDCPTDLTPEVKAKKDLDGGDEGEKEGKQLLEQDAAIRKKSN